MGRPDSLAPITQQPLPQDSLVAGSQLNSYRTQQDEIHSTQNDSYYGSRPRTPTYPEQVFANISFFLTASPTRPPLKYKTKGQDAAAIAAIVEAARRGSFDAWVADVTSRLEERLAPDAYNKCRNERYSLYRDADSIFDPPPFSLLRKVAGWIVSSEYM